MEQVINGFDKEGIFKLYAFLNAYEKAGIGKFKSTKKMLTEHPELGEISDLFKLVNSHKKGNEFMKSVDPKQLRNEVFMTKNKGNLQLSLLAHLRNAIAHANVEENNQKVLITDYSQRHSASFSAIGSVDIEVIEQFTIILNKIKL